jgi:hypothetical protein
MFILGCSAIVESGSKNKANHIVDWPAIGTILPHSDLYFLGDYRDYVNISKDESDNYTIFVPRLTPFSLPFHFQIVREVPRPDSITINDSNKYYEYFEVLCAGHTNADVNFCDTNAISYIDKNDTIAYLITTILSPKVITDTLLSINTTEWITPGFNYKLSLGDSLIAIGRIVSDYPQVDIFRIGESNVLFRLHTVTDGFNVGMSYDGKQFFIERIFMVPGFKNNLKNDIMIYDIPTDKWISLGSADYSYSNPRRISRDDYLYYIKGYKDRYDLWRTYDGIHEELFYNPPPPEYVYEFSLAIRGKLTVKILKPGKEPAYDCMRTEYIHLDSP